MAKTPWTIEQLAAIKARDHDVLVTASAGTGKTAVLAGRCVDIISDQAACPDVRNLLVLTFTEAAASEMKTRIAQAIKEKYIEGRDSHLRRQLLLLEAADISTIHSFCKRLISEHFYKLGIDPTFKIIDPDEQVLLKSNIRDEIIKQAYEDPQLRPAMAELLYGRALQGNSSFLNTIITAYDYLESVADRSQWYQKAIELANESNPFAGLLGQKQSQILAAKIETCIAQLRHAQALDAKLWPGGHWSSQIEEEILPQMLRCLEGARKGTLDKCAAAIMGFEKSKWKNRPKEMDEKTADLVKGPAKKAIETFKALADLAIVNERYLEILAGAVGRQTVILIELIRRFDARYREMKAQLNCLDFSDLEHLALKLLSGRDGNGNMVPSAVAVKLREQFKYIFVDEYQDVNEVQQQILECLSSGNNVFVVGDIKQSIYAWRQAKPEIFLNRLTSASTDLSTAFKGFRIDLTSNFRSRKGVLDFVNVVFARIMSKPFGGIDYDESAMLSAKADYKPLAEVYVKPAAPIVEVHLLTDETADDDDDQKGDAEAEAVGKTSAQQRQAYLIAKQIQDMVGANGAAAQFKVYDKHTKAYRNVEYRDIVILMRSLSSKANEYIDVLRICGVPVNSQTTSGYFEATEITDCISLMCVLDNPQRDIEFAAVLRSPLFNVDETGLLKIRDFANRQGSENVSFYDAVKLYAAGGPDTQVQSQLQQIIAQLDQWRTMSRQGSLADLVWHIFRQTGYLAFVSALPNGQQRKANLLKLHDRAIQFEGFVSSSRRVSLTRFVEFIQKMLEHGQDWSQAQPDNSAQNAVQIMSVHKSKGLEFPVVFLAEVNSQFNTQDSWGQCLMDAEVTLGLQIIDPKTKNRFSSIAHQIICENKKAVSLAEEMRVLYVAMTRAREKLIITASAKMSSCNSVLINGAAISSPTIPDWMLKQCTSPLDWILYSLSDSKQVLDAMGIELCTDARDTADLFDLKLYGSEAVEQFAKEVLQLRQAKTPAAVVLDDGKIDTAASAKFEAIKNAIGWEYQYWASCTIPAKTSVSKLTHRGDEFAASPDAQYEEVVAVSPELREPWGNDQAQSAMLIGTAMHLVMQKLDLTKAITIDLIEDTIFNLVSARAISAELARKIDVRAIMKFFAGDLGQMTLDPANTVHREWPFSYAMPVSGNDKIIVQGIIDLLIETPQGLIIVDFKTDHVSAKNAGQRALRYAQQLGYYADAVAAVIKEPIKAKYLYFLLPGCKIAV